MLNYLENELSANFLADHYQDNVIKKEIVCKNVYFINKNKLILKAKPLYIHEPFTMLNDWIPLDDKTREYKYDKKFLCDFKILKLKPNKKIHIKESVMNIYLFTK